MGRELAEAVQHRPVRGVGEHDHERAERTPDVVAFDHRDHDVADEERGDCGQQAQRPTGVERAQRMHLTLFPPLEQQGGDEKAAEDEEEVDAEEAAGEPAVPPGTSMSVV